MPTRWRRKPAGTAPRPPLHAPQPTRDRAVSRPPRSPPRMSGRTAARAASTPGEVRRRHTPASGPGPRSQRVLDRVLLDPWLHSLCPVLSGVHRHGTHRAGEPPIRDTTVSTALFADPRHRSSGRLVLAFDLPMTV